MSRITQDELSEFILLEKGQMYRLAYTIVGNDADAQDAVSEAIVRAYEKIHQLKKKDSLKAWLMQIVVNSAKNIVAKSSRYVLVEEHSTMEQAVSFASDELWPLVMELAPEYRSVVVLYYYEQFEVKEISNLLNLPVGTVKSRLSRGREKLHRMLE